MTDDFDRALRTYLVCEPNERPDMTPAEMTLREWLDRGQTEWPYVAELEAVLLEVERLRAEVADLLPRMDADALTIDTLARENKRLRAIEQAARNLDAHRDEGYATLVSYLIRLHEALAHNNRA